jgi:CDP-diacylglycerol--serine O-phosphatidyltransferase
MKYSPSILPSLVTVGNLFCGFYAVICAMQGKIILSAWFIIISGVLDVIDGRVARWTNSSSRFGVEYDSLADVVSFGLAPSFLMYTLLTEKLGFWAVLISFLPLLCGSIRLARFNVQLVGFNKDHFVGLPIPVAAGSLSSSILFSSFFSGSIINNTYVIVLLILTVSGLMVSTIRYEVIPDLSTHGTGRQKLLILILVIGILLIILFPYQILFPLSIGYILSGLIRSGIYRNSSPGKGESIVESES